jgi:hypothetical protein
MSVMIGSRMNPLLQSVKGPELSPAPTPKEYNNVDEVMEDILAGLFSVKIIIKFIPF